MLLEVNGLHMAYGDIEAVCGFDLELQAGELVSIIGVNGAGKSRSSRALWASCPAAKAASYIKGRTSPACLPTRGRDWASGWCPNDPAFSLGSPFTRT